jgi:hypothetical protein
MVVHTSNPSYVGSIGRRIMVKGCSQVESVPIQKITKANVTMSPPCTTNVANKNEREKNKT